MCLITGREGINFQTLNNILAQEEEELKIEMEAAALNPNISDAQRLALQKRFTDYTNRVTMMTNMLAELSELAKRIFSNMK